MSEWATRIDQLPNPLTPSAWLPPEMAKAQSFQIYATIGSLAGLSWDIIFHLPEDHEMLTHNRISASIVVYCLSRLSCLLYLVGLTIVQTVPIANCKFDIYVHILYPFTLSFTLLLFVFRVCAIYDNNRSVVAVFSLSWLTVLGTSIMIPLGASATNIGTTKYCIQTPVKPYAKYSGFFPLAHDTLVFVATSWGFLRNSYVGVSFKNMYKVMILGKHLPGFSKSILHDGQAYFLLSLILIITYDVLFVNDNTSPEVVALFGLPSFVVLNNMSCHIYRNMRFGIHKQHPIRTSVIDRALVLSAPSSKQHRPDLDNPTTKV